MNITESLESSRVFTGLAEDEIVDIISLTEERDFKKGDVIFYEQAAGEELFILVNGKVSIQLMLISDNDQMPVSTAMPGDIFGEMAVIDGGTRSATAICEEDSTVKILKKEAFDSLVDKNNRLGMIIYRNISRIISEKIRQTNEKLANNVTWGII